MIVGALLESTATTLMLNVGKAVVACQSLTVILILAQPPKSSSHGVPARIQLVVSKVAHVGLFSSFIL